MVPFNLQATKVSSNVLCLLLFEYNELARKKFKSHKIMEKRKAKVCTILVYFKQKVEFIYYRSSIRQSVFLDLGCWVVNIGRLHVCGYSHLSNEIR